MSHYANIWKSQSYIKEILFSYSNFIKIGKTNHTIENDSWVIMEPHCLNLST